MKTSGGNQEKEMASNAFIALLVHSTANPTNRHAVLEAGAEKIFVFHIKGGATPADSC